MKSITALLQKMGEQQVSSVLFNFNFEGLQIRGIFYADCRSMTLGIEGQNLGWQPEIYENDNISHKLPKEVLSKNIDLFKQNDNSITTKYLFVALEDSLDKLSKIIPPNQADAIRLLGMCITGDKKYDEEGSKPYFWHWKRVKPSSQNLEKIARYFGSEIKKSCIKLGKTAVWSDKLRKDSLSFSDKKTAVELLNRQ